MKDAPIPEFHCLVNFPNYLPKNRSVGSVSGHHTSLYPPGMRCCVMCGKPRQCGASMIPASAALGACSSSDGGGGTVRSCSLVKGVVPLAPKKLPHDASSTPSHIPTRCGSGITEESFEHTHIIPRQNKGLCTSCDVTVWVIASSNLEIKWCKGCKNFRPWAAFGGKGLATKCVRCRDRQKEKYATQREDLRQRRQMQQKLQHEEELRQRRRLLTQYTNRLKSGDDCDSSRRDLDKEHGSNLKQSNDNGVLDDKAVSEGKYAVHSTVTALSHLIAAATGHVEE